MPQKRSRSEAKALGLVRYFTGKPCKYGHTVERYTGDGWCVQCQRDKMLRWAKANPEKNVAKVVAYQKRFRDRRAAKDAAYYRRHRDRILDGYKDKYANDEDFRERLAHQSRQWARDNPEKLSAVQARRRARKLNATPAWADMELIALIYAVRPEGYVVDHVIPLKGKTVCGLHVETNLQYLTTSENCRKGNRFSVAA